ncbi:4-fold beta flower protein [Pelagibacterium sp. H642]|uniref:4-fold beta flower protein n=1 Tax=Pelagibacterium sp. H642 TaxID=1881069 RepID=UPI002815D595|nr:hypothetical protein [Pelagibacterium sp. H642]WMT92794.1 hypothetical protein NO934_18605 [Pelagibacterium sp. H642]
MALDFYDRHGQPRLYSDDGEHLFDWAGNPIAYLKDGHIYGYNGAHLGWLHDGWLVNNSGHRLLIDDGATGGPMKPMKKVKPMKN